MQKSVGAAIFRRTEGGIKFLLLHYPGTRKDYWGLVKGHAEKDEKEPETLKREIEEETGVKDIKIIPDFRKEIRYFFQIKERTIFKKVIFYLVETSQEEVVLSEEHIGFQWLSSKEAIVKATFKGPKKVLKKASNYLNASKS